MPHLYHLVPGADWRAAAGSQYFPRTYQQDGFTHLTADPQFLLSVGNQFYTGIPGPWLCIRLDPAKLTAEVKYEPAAAVGSTPSNPEWSDQQQPQLFPHLYGGINRDAVTAELQVVRDDGGRFLSVSGLDVQ